MAFYLCNVAQQTEEVIYAADKKLHEFHNSMIDSASKKLENKLSGLDLADFFILFYQVSKPD